MSNSLDERIEQIRLLMVDATKKKTAAANLDRKRKRIRAQLIMKAKADGMPATLCLASAEASPIYEQICDELFIAESEFGLAEAEVDAAKLSWETWRTMSSNRRAEMKL